MKKNNKAFTLIELLAIIVILAIIAVITVPIILNIIENSRKGAAIDSAYGYRDAIGKYYVSEMIDKQDLKLDGIYTIEKGKLKGIANEEQYDIPTSGTTPSVGWVKIEENEVIKGCLKIGDYKVELSSKKNNAEKGECEPPKVFHRVNSSDSKLAIGDEVAIDNEHFYVVTVKDENVVLLSKYNLYVGNITEYTTSGLSDIEQISKDAPKYGLQSSKAKGYESRDNLGIGTIKFSNTYNFSSGLELNYPADYPADVYNGENNLKQYVEEYVLKLKKMGASADITGRLLNYTEAIELGCDASEKTCENSTFDWLHLTSYWLGTANDPGTLWGVDSGFWGNKNFGTQGPSCSGVFGVRPVIEVDIDEIEL